MSFGYWKRRLLLMPNRLIFQDMFGEHEHWRRWGSEVIVVSKLDSSVVELWVDYHYYYFVVFLD